MTMRTDNSIQNRVLELPSPATNQASIGRPQSAKTSAVVITCSALMREIRQLSRANGWSHLKVECISAELHNRPEKITASVKQAIAKAKAKGLSVFVAYGDCGTGGQLDALLEEQGVERIMGAHCYELFSGADQFSRFTEVEIGTFYLTDFLVRHFDRLVIHGLGLDIKPELEPLYFGNYRKLLYLAQTIDPDLKVRAEAAATRLGLEFDYHYTGCGNLGEALQYFNRRLSVRVELN